LTQPVKRGEEETREEGKRCACDPAPQDRWSLPERRPDHELTCWYESHTSASRIRTCQSKLKIDVSKTYTDELSLGVEASILMMRTILLEHWPARLLRYWPDRWLVIVLVVASLTCVLNGCGARDRSVKRRVRLAMSSQVYTLMPVIVAQSLRYYDEEGVTVHIENVQSNTKTAHALVGGSADVSTGTFTQVLGLTAQGRDVKAFFTMMVQSRVVLVASPGWAKGIRTVRNLRGAAVGVGGLGGPSNMALNWILAQNGLAPSDVTLVNIGTLATAVAAVERGKVGAAILNDVEYLMLRKRVSIQSYSPTPGVAKIQNVVLGWRSIPELS
jgi:NMT1/THI5 like